MDFILKILALIIWLVFTGIIGAGIRFVVLRGKVPIKNIIIERLFLNYVVGLLFFAHLFTFIGSIPTCRRISKAVLGNQQVVGYNW